MDIFEKIFDLKNPICRQKNIFSSHGVLLYLEFFVVNNYLFFSGELKRKDDLLASMDKKQDEAREKMQEVQMQMQKLQAAPN